MSNVQGMTNNEIPIGTGKCATAMYLKSLVLGDSGFLGHWTLVIAPGGARCARPTLHFSSHFSHCAMSFFTRPTMRSSISGLKGLGQP